MGRILKVTGSKNWIVSASVSLFLFSHLIVLTTSAPPVGKFRVIGKGLNKKKAKESAAGALLSELDKGK